MTDNLIEANNESIEIESISHASNNNTMGKQWTSLLETLNKYDPKKDTLHFVSSKGEIESKVTRKEIDEKSTALATHLVVHHKMSKGDLCLLVFPPSLEFVLAFIACLKAGIIAVPAYPPHPGKSKDVLMFAQIVNDCGATVALTSESYNFSKKMAGIQQSFSVKGKTDLASSWPKCIKWIVVDSILNKGKNMKQNEEINLPFEFGATDIAFLQYTSGSTSNPKGVMITHLNLAHNLKIIINELQAREDTIVVSWLPQYHDMGLIGSLLGIVYCGGTGYYMSPLSFLQRPMLWLECVSRFQGTHLQAPNFAFKLISRKFDATRYSNQDLSLSSVRHIINAAEPIDAQSLEIFAKTFAPFGLRREVIFPTYGLAEHTVFVCSGGQQVLAVNKEDLERRDKVIIVEGNNTENINIVRSIVGCGYPAKQNVDVRIVNSDTLEELDEDLVGEIWINSPSKALGYYKMSEQTSHDFHAKIDGVDEHTYLRSGDLGFIHNGELFICGRLKDMIIVAGRNYFPQDLEATCESVSSLIRPGCIGAFSVSDDDAEEQVVLISELREIIEAKLCSEIAESIRAAIAKEHSLSLSTVVFLKPRTVPKTTSGKISRSRCRKAFLSNELQTIFVRSFTSQIDSQNCTNGVGNNDAKMKSPVDPTILRNLEKSVIQTRLVGSISEMIFLPPSSISNSDPLNTMLDSIKMSQLKGMLEHEYCVRELTDSYLFRESVTIMSLVEVIKIGYAPDDNDDNALNESNASSSEAMMGTSSGLAGALGCPPGVCCSIM